MDGIRNLAKMANLNTFIEKVASKPASAVTPQARKAIEGPPTNPKPSPQIPLTTQLSTLIQRADSWPYKTETAADGVELKLIQPATSSLGRMGFNLLKVTKDVLLLPVRMAAGVVGGTAGVALMAGALLTMPFSNELSGKLLFSGMTLASTSLISGLSAPVRLAGAVADLAQPLTKKDMTISLLNKVGVYCLGKTQDINIKAAISFTGISFQNPSAETDDDLFEDEPVVATPTQLILTDEQFQKQQIDKLKFGKTTNKVMSLISGLSGSHALLASTSPFTSSKLTRS